MRKVVTPHYVSGLCSAARQARQAYRDARRAWGLVRLSRDLLAREDAAFAAWEARWWMHRREQRLADTLRDCDVVKGSAMCPNAQDRARVAGRLRP